VSVFDRLREERARLGLSQQDVANLCEVHLKTAQRWEASTPVPSDQLAVLAANGFDVQYVTAGVRSTNAGWVREESPAYNSEAALSPDEWKLVKRFRALGETQRPQALAMLEVLALGGSTGGTTVIAKGKGTKAAGHAIYETGKKPRKGG
jgi:transcriptional regulator with XRE-family HTH domain